MIDFALVFIATLFASPLACLYLLATAIVLGAFATAEEVPDAANA